MNLEKLYEIQGGLDAHIIKEKGLEGENLIPNLFLALKVEVAELANETRCFKHWSNKKASPREVILEEYADGLHFALSLGNHTGFHKNHGGYTRGGSLTDTFNDCFIAIADFEANSNQQTYDNLLASFFQIGKTLGFSLKEIEEAYLKKNEINHRRQMDGY
ncbi:Dimeric dUTPase, all-alpha-NTP-PPase (MazG) superfamily [Halobacillus karajensis]|uniref:dUTP diphosphatase n=1 Tax=Halobacillus karajensis TaxID=195088 RepID=UPI0008A7DA2F|nr:dUTP diphosphatase [Halobacillus karajensis]SEH77973.1 Dimeric dUTPase, all-alpha-NTP-PPase (MazG) superfamily [Halobacillus karajensis]